MTVFYRYSFFKHVLSSLFEIAASFVVKLLFGNCCSSLGLVYSGISIIICSGWIVIVVMICGWSLLHTHHGRIGSGSSFSAIIHPSCHSLCKSTLPRHFWLWSWWWNLRLFPNNVHHTVFKGFFVLAKTILFPSEIRNFGIHAVSLHASLEEANAEFVIGLLFKLEFSAVFHILLELWRLTLTEWIKTSLELLLFNVFILFVLIFSR